MVRKLNEDDIFESCYMDSVYRYCINIEYLLCKGP